MPFPDTYYKIVKPGTTEELDANIEGEICISGPSVMVCYVDNEEETRNPLRRHGDGDLRRGHGADGRADRRMDFPERILRDAAVHERFIDECDFAA